MDAEGEGQVEGTSNETIPDSPDTQAHSDQITQDGPVEESQEAFFDYDQIKDQPELVAAYKQMQSAFTKKQMGISEANKANEAKMREYDAFMSNPQAEIQRLATQYGIGLNGAAEQESAEPASWDDVYSTMRQQVMQELNPVFQEIENSKKHNIESHMDNNYPDWRQYEGDMKSNLEKHPSLSSDPGLLYRMSVPEKVLTARATQAALGRIQNQSANAQVSGGNSTTRPQGKSTKASSFNEAWQMAKDELAAK